jgi:hypothetical protein
MNTEEKLKFLGRLKPKSMVMADVLKKLKSGKFPELTYVGKNYTKADLIADLESIQERMNFI